ncbi:mg/Co/Ni transporter MgtE [Coriobacteriaceae bacterium EMTCatB1]|nr:mg/Co/Ni transporter MgtE [Coriobacteriaceae bacterium EMTCatB1]
MFYLTRMLGKPVVDAAGETIGRISDVAVATGEVFPRVTALAFLGPGKTPFMLSWRKYVESIDDDKVVLNATKDALRFSYLQPDEILLARDLLNKQIVDTQGMKVVRVNDLKLSESRNQLRLLGAEVGIRGILRGLHPALETAAERIAKLFGKELPENIIAWNYMDLLERDLSQVKLSVTHKRLHELHPADIADVLEQLTPAQRAKVFEHLDNSQAAETISELEDAFQAEVIGDLGAQRASDILEIMDPDDAADIIGDLPYDKAEALLRLMGVNEARAIRSLLGYREKTAGGIMTPEVTRVTEDMTVSEVIEHIRKESSENESLYYIYVVDADGRLEGVVSLRDLVLSDPGTKIADIVSRDVITAHVDDDQEDVAETMSKYDLLALPVVDETGKLLGVVTVDDALEVLEEESAEDLELATGASRERGPLATAWWLIVRRNAWVALWALALLAAASLNRNAQACSKLPAACDLVLAAAILSPIILRAADEVSSRTITELIDATPGGEHPSFARRLLRESGIGSAVAVAAAAVAFLWVEVAGTAEAGTAALFALVTAAAVLVTVFVGSALGEAALKASDAGKTPPSSLLTLAAMVVGSAAYLGLAYALGAWIELG